MTTGSADPQIGETSVRLVFDRLTVELEHAAEQLLAVELAISVMFEHLPGLDLEAMKDVQQVDKIRQSLEALSIFTADVVDQIPYSFSVDCAEAIGRIKLGDMARRLTGARAADREKPVDDGEIDLFS